MGERSQKQREQLRSYNGPTVVKDIHDLQKRLKGTPVDTPKFWDTVDAIKQVRLENEAAESANKAHIFHLEAIHSSIGNYLRFLKENK